MAHGGIDDDGIHEIFVLAVHRSSVMVSKITITPEEIVVTCDDKGNKVLRIERSELAKMSVASLARRLQSAREDS